MYRSHLWFRFSPLFYCLLLNPLPLFHSSFCFSLFSLPLSPPRISLSLPLSHTPLCHSLSLSLAHFLFFSQSAFFICHCQSLVDRPPPSLHHYDYGGLMTSCITRTKNNHTVLLYTFHCDFLVFHVKPYPPAACSKSSSTIVIFINPSIWRVLPG